MGAKHGLLRGSRQENPLGLEYYFLMKVKAAVKKICSKCQIVRRKGYVYVSAKPTHAISNDKDKKKL
jgi:ribosomal protein L36, bacterial type